MAIIPHDNTKALQELLDRLSDFDGISNHESLQGLLGGDASGHYHMTAEQLNKLILLLDNGANTNHESLQGLLGGNSSGRYHLTADLLNKLINLPVDGGGNGQLFVVHRRDDGGVDHLRYIFQIISRIHASAPQN